MAIRHIPIMIIFNRLIVSQIVALAIRKVKVNYASNDRPTYT